MPMELRVITTHDGVVLNGNKKWENKSEITGASLMFESRFEFEIWSTVTGSSSTSQPSDYHGIPPAPPPGGPMRPELPRYTRPNLGRPELGGGLTTFLTVSGSSSGEPIPPVRLPDEPSDQ